MCCNNKCMFFIGPRMGSLIFGYFMAVVSAIGVLVNIVLILYFVTMMLTYYNKEVPQTLVYVEIMFFECVAGFTCTVLMLYGITKNKPVLVKTYIIYSMIQLVLMLAIAIIFFSVSVFVGGVLMVMISVVYSLFVYLVFLAYNDMNSNRQPQVFSNPPIHLMA